MLVLDTDHLSELDRNSIAGKRLVERVRRSVDDVATTIVTAQEQLRGWIAQVNRFRNPHQQVMPYARLQGRIEFFAEWLVLPFDDAAADRFDALRASGLRTGSMDLKIASIVLVNGATLLSRNLSDFENIPGLRVEDWL